MYIVTLHYGDIVIPIHNDKVKLASGKVTKGINTIDSFTFSLYPNNPGFHLIYEFTTHIRVYNMIRSRYDFIGRVLYAETAMDEDGTLSKTVTCENVFGYLCDSVQAYVGTQNWTVAELLQRLIGCHNSQVEGYKRFKIGAITAEDKNDNLYVGISRENTWDSIKSNLLDKIGGELQLRVEEDGMYIDYLKEIGEHKTTEIALSVNMKAITREQIPTEIVTRLIPLGSKIKIETDITDEEGNTTTESVETEQRVDITSVNDGRNYIDDEDAIALYGIHVGVVEWDDIHEPIFLLAKGLNHIKEINRVQVKYSVSSLELSLINIAFEELDVGNYHPLKNSLIGIDDVGRIIKKNIDVCQEVESTIEIGDNIKSISDIQREQAKQIGNYAKSVQTLKTETNNLVSSVNKKVGNLESDIKKQTEEFSTEIQQLSDSIKLEVSGSLGSKANIILSAGANQYSYEMDMSQVRKAFADDNTAISISAGLITFNAGTLVINSTNFTLDSEGTITAKAGEIGGWTLMHHKLFAGDGVDIKTVAIQAPQESTLYVFAAGGTSHDSYADCPFRVTKAGKLYATDAIVYGDIITIDGVYKTEMDRGSLRLYYDDVLCGTINTKYWSGASTEGISLRVEEGGNYIMFSHADDTQGSGYVVDYYLNAGWSSNYDEMHIFQTSARFLSDAYFAGKTRIRSLRLFDADGEYLVGINNGQLTVSKL